MRASDEVAVIDKKKVNVVCMVTTKANLAYPSSWIAVKEALH